MKSLSQSNIRNKYNEGKIIDISSETNFHIKKPIPILSRYKIKGINDKVMLPKIKKIHKIQNNISIKNHFIKKKVRFIPEINLDYLFREKNKYKIPNLKNNLSDFSSSTLSTLPLSSRPFHFNRNISNINIINSTKNEKKNIFFHKKMNQTKYQLQQYFL